MQTEGHMVVGCAVGEKLVGALEVALVEVGRRVPKYDLVASPERLPVQVSLGGHRAAKVHGDRRPAQHLLDECFHLRHAHGRQGLEERWSFNEREQSTRHRVTGGVVAGCDHQSEEVLEREVVETFTVDGRLEQRVQDVVGRGEATRLEGLSRVLEEL